MQIPLLNSVNRTKLGKNSSKKSRRQGLIPAVVYGNPSILVNLDQDQTLEILRKFGENTAVELNTGNEKITAVIKEVQKHPINQEILHIDFKPVNQKEKVKVKVPVAFTHTEYLNNQGEVMQTHKDEVEIECKVTDIPKNIQVNVGKYKPGDTLIVKDIEVGAEISIIDNLESIIASFSDVRNVE